MNANIAPLVAQAAADTWAKAHAAGQHDPAKFGADVAAVYAAVVEGFAQPAARPAPFPVPMKRGFCDPLP